MSDGGQARALARGSLAQQVAQATGLATMFAIVTVLARRLSLAELGVYGLLSSLAGYLLIVQNAAASAVVRTLAAALDEREERRAYSSAKALYSLAGLLAGAIVALLGVLLAAGLDLTPEVERQARLGAGLGGLVTAVGWPLTINRDLLRGRRLYVRAALAEIAAMAAYAALVLGLALGGAPLGVIVGAGAAIPLIAGVACTLVARASGVHVRFSPRDVDRATTGEMVGLAGYVSLSEAAATLIYVVNRAVLGLFQSAATVGLFEGPVRAHNLLRSLNSASVVTVLPAASRYSADGDRRRLEMLLLRGSRYTLALVVPLAVTGAVMAAPLLDAWLGDGFREGGAAMAILLSHWVVNGCSGVLGAVLVGAGRAASLARYAVLLTLSNVALALALAPDLGLEGIALATAVPYLALFPLLLRWALSTGGLRPAAFLREALAPAWALGAGLAAGMAGLRFALEPEGAAAVFGCVAAGAGAYWIAFYALALDADERALVRAVAGRLRT